MTEKLLGNLSKGLVFVVSAPAGTGKTTLVRMLAKEFNCIAESISCTTRSRRASEEEGKDYYFLSKEDFVKKIAQNEFLEYAEVFGNYYGTSRKHIESLLASGKHVILVIDTQGAATLQSAGYPATYIFIAPPSVDELEKRMLKRESEDEHTLKERLSWAHKEIEASSAYQYLIVNQDLQIAYEVLKSIVIAEEHRVHNKHSCKEKIC